MRLKKYLVAGLFGVLTTTTFGQSDEDKDFVVSNLSAQQNEQSDSSLWNVGGLISLNFSQVALTNWSAGGESSISATGAMSLFANYKKGNVTWDNNLDLGFGMLRQGDEDFRKTDDKIDLTSKYGKFAFKNWYYSGLLNFKSQFAPGFDFPNDEDKISDLFAPAYVLAALGMDYKPNDNFSLFISPVTAKFTIVNDQDLADAGAFGVEPATINEVGDTLKGGERSLTEVGGYIKLMWKKDIVENVDLQTRLELFSSYTEQPENIDVLWETLINFKVNEYINANITSTVFYDHDIAIAIDDDDDGMTDRTGPRTQFKEVFALGFAYKF